MNSEFLKLGFKKILFVQNRNSIADGFSSKNRCGIYILHFKNGEHYVGQAKDVVNRYAQHRLTYADIECISFQSVAQSRLDKVERSIVYELENFNKPLRNINIVSKILGETDLDLVVSEQKQQAWMKLKSKRTSFQLKERFNYPELRKKYNVKFAKLQSHPRFEELLFLLKEYILKTVLRPELTEYSFWSCSCLPSTADKPLIRVNIFWQETFVIYENANASKSDFERIPFYIRIWMAKSILKGGGKNRELKKKFHSLNFINRIWPTGGQDQLCAEIDEEGWVQLESLSLFCIGG